MAKKRVVPKVQIKKVNALQWVFERLESHPDFIQKRMFGCSAAYLNSRLVLVLADSEEPWNGVLVPTEREFHASLAEKFPGLIPHPVLGKWLYLSQSHPEFEGIAGQIVDLILRRDARVGVEPKLRKTRKSVQAKLKRK